MINWDKIKDVATQDTGRDVAAIRDQYIELSRLGLFTRSKWWVPYESEMFKRGISWEECYKHFPLMIKFLCDISKGHEGHERFVVNRELALVFNNVLYQAGVSEEDILAKASMCKQLKFIQAICEMCGLALEPTKEFQKMYSLIGAGGDGKSLLLGLFDEVMNGTINGNLCGHTPIDELGDKFALQSLVNQTCNISDDTNDKVINNTGIIKTLIGAGGTGTGITVPRKNLSDFFWTDPQILLIIAGNRLPKFKDTSDGMMRRIIYMPFKNSLKKRMGDMDLKLGSKLRLNSNNIALLFWLGRMAIGDARFRGDLTEMDESLFIKNRFEEGEKDDVQKFIDFIETREGVRAEYWLLGDAYIDSKLAGGEGIAREMVGRGERGGTIKTTQDVYECYVSWKNSLGEEDIMGPRLFGKEFLDKLDYSMSITRKNTRVAGKVTTMSYYIG